MWSRISAICVPCGADSDSTENTSRNSPIARGTIIAAISSDAIASACTHPDNTITSAAMMTAADPSRSPITSRYAPRTLMLFRCAELNSQSATAFATSPTIAMTSITPPSTSASPGAIRRPTLSTAIQTDSAISTAALIRAPNTSAR